ncbi:hypothetical protein ACM42_02525 [Bradyrhizobium sp. CCBAU 25338]|nr:hypothetical protein [Bradyrhizobium sp. CCBAU 45389]MDA9437065.1 hypothetical protein [Bradyrhizobium sp. CCBAU 51627]MDA9527326.1 hypothetical protein [Bradyrhizobium sp. CCBAU 25338]RXH24291.1 hypothetical protein XH84_32945 [Bradyrhizobium nanningense]
MEDRAKIRVKAMSSCRAIATFEPISAATREAFSQICKPPRQRSAIMLSWRLSLRLVRNFRVVLKQ